MVEKSLRNQIIESLFVGDNFNNFIAKLEPAHLRDDLKQEVAVIICSWPDEKIIGLEERGELSFYVVRMVFNMVSNKYHPFHKKYRSINYEFKEMLSDPYLDAKDLTDDFEDRYAFKRGGESEPADESLAFRDTEREQREALEDFTMLEIENLHWYSAELVRLYMQLGNYRALGTATGIPYISCYKTIQKSLEILRQKAKAPKPLFTKEELNFIQSKTNFPDEKI